MVQKLVPLCSSQYERQFNTVRVPGKESGKHQQSLVQENSFFFSLSDRIIHYADSHHIAIYNKGRWYKVFMFYKNMLLQPSELQL